MFSYFKPQRAIAHCLLLIPALLLMNFHKAQAAYCVPSNPTCAGTNHITVVSINGTSFNNASNGCSGLNGPAYTIFAVSPQTTATLQPGGTYQISVTCNGNSVVSLWIDYNQNQQFESNEWTLVTSTTTAGIPSTASFTIPSNAVTGLTGLRIRSRLAGSANGAGDQCTAFGSGEAEDYSVTIGSTIPCTAPPSGGFTTSTSNPVCAGNQVTLSLNSASTGSGLSYQWQGSSDSLIWSILSGANSSVYTYTSSTTAYYRCQVTCNGSSAFSVPLKVMVDTAQVCYCNSSAVSFLSTDIGRVAFGNKSNGSATPELYNSSANNTYTDYTSLQPIDIEAGSFLPIAVSQICSDNFSPAQIIVYADWNHDGTFAYLNESTYIGQTTFGTGGSTITGMISVPIGAQIGLTRLRIILTENGALNQAPCGTYPFGETEDYTLNITQAIPCLPTPLAGFAESTHELVCTDQFFTLNLRDGSAIYNSTFYWESSVDSLSWTFVPNSNGMYIFSTTQTQSNYYRCVATCGFTTVYSSPVFVESNALENCYCSSAATGALFSNIGNVSIGTLNSGNALPVLSNPGIASGYTYFSQLTPPALEIGSNYTLSVSQISFLPSFNAAYVYAFFDFNKDAFFDSNESYYVGTTNSFLGGNTLSLAISIPQTALTGVTRMRILLSESISISACGNYSFSGETEDYQIEIVPFTPCSGTPVGGITIADTAMVCPNKLATLSLTGNTASGGVTYQWQVSADSLLWTNVFGEITNTLNVYQLTSSYYRCAISCNGLVGYSSSLLISIAPPSMCYCSSAAISNSDTDIGNVTFSTLNNGIGLPVTNNSAALNVYTDYTSVAAPVLQQGGDYGISISQITYGSAFYSAYASIFIDFNQDGTFGSNELFLPGIPTFSPGQTTINSHIAIPLNAALGLTRMRIILAENNAQTQPCTNYSYGETEDYTVNIVPSVPCAPVLTGGVALSTLSSVCYAENFTLSLTGNTNDPNVRYQWQSSLDNINWVSISGATWTNHTMFQFGSSYYRCELTCGANTSYSSSVYVTQKPIKQCYCISAAASTQQGDIGRVELASIANGNPSPITNNPNAVNTYTDYTSITPINLELGISYPIQVTQISNSNSIVSATIYAYIDFNQDGSFGVNEAFFVGNTSSVVGGNVVANTVIVPQTATLGLTRMRVVLIQGGGAQQYCGLYNYGETEDYPINIIAQQPCVLPTAGNSVASDSTLCSGNTFSLSLQNNSTSPSQTYQWQYSFDAQNWISLTGQTGSIVNVVFSQSLYYRCQVSCAALSAFSSAVYVSANPAAQCYCISAATNIADDDIGNVTFGTLSNGIGSPATSNATSNNLYTDFTFLPAQVLLKGQSYPISVTQINSAGFYTCRIVVYIDFNQNGVFEVVGEKIDLGYTTNALGGNTKSGTILVPLTAISGTTRMRIVLQEGGTAVSNPCGTYTWGETEDYLVQIIGNQTCTVAPNAGNANTSQASLCQNFPFTLYLTGNSSSLGQTYRWQASVDGITWNYISNASLDSAFVAAQSIDRFYRCEITCGNLQAYSVAVFVSVSQSALCGYCTIIGGTPCPSNNKITNVNIFNTSLNNSDTACYSLLWVVIQPPPYLLEMLIWQVLHQLKM